MTKSFFEDTNPAMQEGLAELIGEDVLKTASEQCMNLPDNASPLLYADAALLEHPVFTRETALATAVYVKMAGYNLAPGVVDRIRTAVNKFGHVELVSHIEDALDEADEPTTQKTASTVQEEWALNIDNNVAYPISTYESVVDSAARMAFDYAHARLPAPYLKTAAAQLMDNATKLQVDDFMIPDVIKKHASARLPDMGKASKHIGLRVANLGDKADVAASEYKEAMASVNPDNDPEREALLAALRIQEIDKRYNVKISNINIDPLSMVFDDRSIEDITKVANQSVCLFDTSIPANVFANICDRLPLPALFDEVATTKIAAASVLARSGEGMKATELLDSIDENPRHTLARSLLASASNPGCAVA